MFVSFNMEDYTKSVFIFLHREKDMWIKRLSLAIAIIVAFLLTFLAIDFLNPNVGWVRAAVMIGMQCYL